jgi:hypothetical protein
MLMNGELESYSEENRRGTIRYYPDTCQEGLSETMKTSVKIDGTPAKIRNGHFPEHKFRAFPIKYAA